MPQSPSPRRREGRAIAFFTVFTQYRNCPIDAAHRLVEVLSGYMTIDHKSCWGKLAVLLEGGHQKVKITDFGLARAVDDASISQSGFIAETPMYMAPEQAQGQTLDQRADLFSLGSVLYQMVSGRPPFRANTTLAALKRVAEDKPRAIREIIPETPQWLCDIIAKLHAKDPADRYQSAREVADVLADCEAQLQANAKLTPWSFANG